MGLSSSLDMQVRLKFLTEDCDRYGNIRCYVRVPGKKKIRLRGLPGTPEFLTEYREAISTLDISKPRQTNEAKRGSFRQLCVNYFKSVHYKSLDPSTRNWQRRALDEICQEHGAKPVAMMAARHVRKIRDALAETPAAANQRLKALRALFAWGNEADETTVNPTIGVKRIRYHSPGHHTWTTEEVEQYQERHKIGSQARLAFDILRFTTGRREDIPRLGRQHIREGRIRFRQAKNEHRHPIDIDIPIHPDLQASIDATLVGNLTFLVAKSGRPFSANGFGGKFKDWCRQAGLPHCSAHGVRKASATEMAENEATPHQIMAVTGHQSLKEVDRYTRAARRRKMADAGVAKLK